MPAAVGASVDDVAVVLVADVAFGRVDGYVGEGLVDGWHSWLVVGVGVFLWCWDCALELGLSLRARLVGEMVIVVGRDVWDLRWYDG